MKNKNITHKVYNRVRANAIRLAFTAFFQS